MTPLPLVTAAGAAVGGLVGIFGVGGSSIAGPLLALAGVPSLAAIASPLPAAIPAAMVAARPYVRSGDARRAAAAWTLLGAVPATVAGGLLSRAVGGPALLLASGAILVPVGLRVLLPVSDGARETGARRRQDRPLLVASAACVGLVSGLLANGGGFLLVPLYVLAFGLRMRQAVGTSLLVVAALSVPNLITHWALGHIDWAVAGAFAVGALPASFAASRWTGHFGAGRQRRFFGLFLIAFGLVFTAYRLWQGS